MAASTAASAAAPAAPSAPRASSSSSSARRPAREGAVVFPGDVIGALAEFEAVVLGPGVQRQGGALLAARVGYVRWDAQSSILSVDSAHRRYVPAVGDHVVGLFVNKHAEEYRVDVGGAAAATLPCLAFDGASKRNRPNLAVGMLVYARVRVASKHMDPELSCHAPPGVAAKDWVRRL